MKKIEEKTTHEKEQKTLSGAIVDLGDCWATLLTRRKLDFDQKKTRSYNLETAEAHAV